ncbi:MAG: SPOR domain-containing protein [Burkholderiales bacterium]|nr:MAG: SPOR domain-containing protein [Burkholderiales bacterium]
MPLPSFLQRLRQKSFSGQAVSDAAPLTSADVELARARARRRLVGMVVLVGAGVIGFPWLFETQPRSMSADVQIVQAGGDAGEVQIAGSSAPAARSPRSVAGRVAVSEIVEPKAPAVHEEPAKVVDEPVEPTTREPEPKAMAKPASKPVEKPAMKQADKPAAKDNAKDKAKDQPKAQAKSDKSADKPADKSSDKDKAPTRYVVQFGAFADVNTAHEARMKVERLGIKTYAQQVDTPAGKRIRVRMGPYADKAEAEKTLATLRKSGLSGAVLTL